MMNKIYMLAFILILAVSGVSGKAQAQTDPVPYLSDTFCVSTGSPVLLTRGKTVTIVCDSMYMINKLRYKLYQRLHQHISQWGPSCDTLTRSYEQSLQASEEAYRQLLENYGRSDRLAQAMIDSTHASLLQMKQSLEHTENILQSSRQELEKTRHALRKVRRQTFLQRVSLGLGGLGIGLLFGLVI